jgi:hypothetical protein
MTIASQTTIKLHARMSASGSARWTSCHGSLREEDGKPDQRNAAAEWGTVAHDLAEGTLRHGDWYLETRLGARGVVRDDGTVYYVPANKAEGHAIDDEMADCVESYVNLVRGLALGGTLLIEERLSIEHITGETGAKGTCDAGILFFKQNEICIVDLKGGFFKVYAKELQADGTFKPNTQLVMYASALLEQYRDFCDWERVRIIVCQPRLKHVDEHVMPIAEFEQWVQWLRERAEATKAPDAPLVPSEKACQFCKAFPCSAAKDAVLKAALDDFDTAARVPPNDLSELARLKKLIPLIEQFVQWINTRVRNELQSGNKVPGYKLVQGDQGDRKWTDQMRVVACLQVDGVDPEDYQTRNLKSPAQIEKLARPKTRKLSKETWERLQNFIIREEGSPKVVPDSDSRPAMGVNHADDFQDESVGDLFQE